MLGPDQMCVRCICVNSVRNGPWSELALSLMRCAVGAVSVTQRCVTRIMEIFRKYWQSVCKCKAATVGALGYLCLCQTVAGTIMTTLYLVAATERLQAHSLKSLWRSARPSARTQEKPERVQPVLYHRVLERDATGG
jgi:hypothetical protein